MSQSLSVKNRLRSARARPSPTSRRRNSAPRKRGAAREALLEAARAEFDEAGYEGTDTNRIARRAGYAPQTFYRHFTDKAAIFVETYQRWLEAELKDLSRARGKGADAAALLMLSHHERHREFRRSLRRQTLADATIRKARARSRASQLELMAAEDEARGRKRSRETLAALMFSIERIADAAADGELADLGFPRAKQVEMLAELMRRFARVD